METVWSLWVLLLKFVRWDESKLTVFVWVYFWTLYVGLSIYFGLHQLCTFFTLGLGWHGSCVSHKLWSSLHFFSIFFFCLDSIELPSSLMTIFFVICILLFSLSSEFYISVISFLNYKISIWFCLISYIFWWDFLFFHLF